jgi:hypothetical protein
VRAGFIQFCVNGFSKGRPGLRFLEAGEDTVKTEGGRNR